MTAEDVSVDGAPSVHVEVDGAGPPLLLLHGFPETSLMWRDLVPPLAERFTVVRADLPGYGASTCPEPAADHAQASKRAMARSLVGVMAELGFERFSVAGHDRGGRVTYRMALDHPDRVQRAAVLDVVPIDTAWEHADQRLALGFWPWSLLAQPEPLPERLIGADPGAVIDVAMGPEWGTPAATFDDDVRDAYTAQLSHPDHLHAICEEYRAAAGIDIEHDRADRSAGRTIDCPLLVLWSADGPLGSWYDELDGPLGVWRTLARAVEGHGVAGGHFFAEEDPTGTARLLTDFFTD